MRRRWLLVTSSLLLGVLVGCTSDAPAVSPANTEPVSVDVSADGTAYTAKALSLRFDLSPSFRAVDDEELAFLARSIEPMAIISIDRDVSGNLSHEAEEGESVSAATLGDVKATVVSNAVVEGLPDGIAANELLVDNESQSFSVIMSASPADLATLWDPFVESIQVQAA